MNKSQFKLRKVEEVYVITLEDELTTIYHPSVEVIVRNDNTITMTSPENGTVLPINASFLNTPQVISDIKADLAIITEALDFVASLSSGNTSAYYGPSIEGSELLRQDIAKAKFLAEQPENVREAVEKGDLILVCRDNGKVFLRAGVGVRRALKSKTDESTKEEKGTGKG